MDEVSPHLGYETLLITNVTEYGSPLSRGRQGVCRDDVEFIPPDPQTPDACVGNPPRSRSRRRPSIDRRGLIAARPAPGRRRCRGRVARGVSVWVMMTAPGAR